MKNIFFIILSLIALLVIIFFLIISPPKTVIESDNLPVTATSTDEVTPGSKHVTPSLKEKISYNDIMIEVWAVMEDSRCPTDVQCIQAGRARVSLNIYSLEGEHILSRELEEGTFFYAGSTKITLQKVNPYPISTKKTGDADYRFELLLEVIE